MRKVIVDGLLVLVSLVVVLGFLLLPLGLAMAGEPDGKALYSGKCAMRHGADGAAKSMWAKQGVKNLNDAAWQKQNADAAIVKAIQAGFPDRKMPGYKDKLTAEEITAIVKHIRTLPAPK